MFGVDDAELAVLSYDVRILVSEQKLRELFAAALRRRSNLPLQWRQLTLKKLRDLP